MYTRDSVRLLIAVLFPLMAVAGLAGEETIHSETAKPPTPTSGPAAAATSAAGANLSPQPVSGPRIVQRTGAVATVSQKGLPLADRRNAVLLVPSGQPQQEQIVALHEDLTVMCRIFDRLLTQAGLKGQSLAVYELFFTDDSEDWRSGFLGSSHTECLYVEGYGPVFLMNVDFPLTPPPQDQVENDADGPTDSLWNQVRQETYAPRSRRGARSGEPRSPYSEEKVRLLKETVIRALRHAANIRGLDRDAWLTVTARGPRAIGDEPYARTGRGGRTRLEDIYGGLDVYTGVATAAPAQPAAMLTIRAKVRDVSAVASGELELDEFRKHIEITEY